MSGETDQALEMHNRYAQFKLKATACFTPGTPANLEGWEKIDRTIHLKPFLELLIREFKSRLGKTVDLKSTVVARANWIGDEDLLNGTLTPKEFILGIITNNPDSLVSRAYLGFVSRLESLKLVPNHMGVVALDAGVEWLKLSGTSYVSDSDRIKDIQNSVVSHINFCSVNTITVSKENGITYYQTSEVIFSDINKALVIKTLKSVQIPEVGSIVEDWIDKEGIYVMHKGEVIDCISEQDAKLIESSRAYQIKYLNEFIQKS